MKCSWRSVSCGVVKFAWNEYRNFLSRNPTAKSPEKTPLKLRYWAYVGGPVSNRDSERVTMQWISPERSLLYERFYFVKKQHQHIGTHTHSLSLIRCNRCNTEHDKFIYSALKHQHGPSSITKNSNPTWAATNHALAHNNVLSCTVRSGRQPYCLFSYCFNRLFPPSTGAARMQPTCQQFGTTHGTCLVRFVTRVLRPHTIRLGRPHTKPPVAAAVGRARGQTTSRLVPTTGIWCEQPINEFSR